jgi:hypothetical protein
MTAFLASPEALHATFSPSSPIAATAQVYEIQNAHLWLTGPPSDMSS